MLFSPLLSLPSLYVICHSFLPYTAFIRAASRRPPLAYACMTYSKFFVISMLTQPFHSSKLLDSCMIIAIEKYWSSTAPSSHIEPILDLISSKLRFLTISAYIFSHVPVLKCTSPTVTFWKNFSYELQPAVRCYTPLIRSKTKNKKQKNQASMYWSLYAKLYHSFAFTDIGHYTLSKPALQFSSSELVSMHKKLKLPKNIYSSAVWCSHWCCWIYPITNSSNT